MKPLFKKGYKLKIPDNDRIGIGFLKIAIPRLSTKKLLGVKGVIENYPDSPEKKELLEIIKKEFIKRKLEWVDD